MVDDLLHVLAGLQAWEGVSVSVKSKPRKELLMRHIRVADNECWEWTAFKKPNGYGQFGRNGYAHRASYEEFVGPISKDMVIDHLCRNRACVNPKHLEPVTQRENLLRGEGFVAVHARKTHCKRGHVLAGKNLTLRSRPEGGRECSECRRMRQRGEI